MIMLFISKIVVEADTRGDIAWSRGEELFHFYDNSSDAGQCADKEGFRGPAVTNSLFG